MTDRKERVSDAHLAYVLEMAKDFHHEFGFSEDEWLAFALDLQDSRERVRELEDAVLHFAGARLHCYGQDCSDKAHDTIADIRRRKEQEK